jgi:hypothetical protein
MLLDHDFPDSPIVLLSSKYLWFFTISLELSSLVVMWYEVVLPNLALEEQ